ncbi:MAG: bifunctional metallophosphatase/5'-nucleotidase [Planctomycetota bacterium]|jgi:5'-nucleotidase
MHFGHMQRSFLWMAVCALSALAAGASCATAQDEAAPAPAPARKTLTILHTNDWHGYAFAEPPRRDPTAAPEGGVVACAAAVQRIRSERPDSVLVLDAGDLFSGHAAASFSEDGVKGLPFVKLWDRIGFDAFAIGNHEFDHGRENLTRTLAAIKTPALCANWVQSVREGKDTTGPHVWRAPVQAKPYLVFERAGMRVAVIGLLTGDMRGLASAETLSGTAVIDPLAALLALMPEVEAVSDVQIALTHCGLATDLELARAVPSLEAVIGGHSHTWLNEPTLVGGRPVCQAGANGRGLGRLDLTFEGTKLVENKGQILTLPRPPPEGVPAELLAAEQALLERIQVLEDTVIGIAARPFGRAYYAQSDLGWAVAESTRLAAETDLGFVNSGGVRQDLGEGPVTGGEVIAVLPFENHLVRFELTGKQLFEALEFNAKAGGIEDHGILQIAGASYRYQQQGQHVKVVEVEVDGAPLDPERVYTGASNAYVVEQAEKYFGRPIGGQQPLGKQARAAFEQAVKGGLLQREIPVRAIELPLKGPPPAKPPGG